ncbi:MAG: response regulator [Nitrospinae bacterium]|nr:response regulator [Nitrospinota bacterium]
MGKKVLIIDDDKTLLDIAARYLKKAGFETLALEDSSMAMKKIESFNPDVVVVDLMMPKIDGLHLLKSIKEAKGFGKIKTIAVSAKSFEFDKNRAYEMGAQFFLKKPLDYESLVAAIDRVIKDEMKIVFWGTRGTLAKPGPETLKFGGNTSCVSVELTQDRLFIFDGGTGITELGKKMMASRKRYKMNFFITHPHWDHINGFPFFMPLYQQGNEMVVYGSSHGNVSLREVISGQMESIYFPVTLRAFGSRVYFKEIFEGDYEIEGLSLKTLMLNHPGITLGYRLANASGKSMAYITDNELAPEEVDKDGSHARKKLVNFLDGVDVLIHDSSYFDEEYKKRVGWGHPPLTEVLKLAAEAKVKNVYLTHHDPDHDDARVEEKEAAARRFFEERGLDIQCYSAIEGSAVIL